MKRALGLLFLILVLFASAAQAQTRILVGVAGSNSFDNLSAGLLAGAEIPYHRYEVDLFDIYSPYESHLGLGQGHANIASFGNKFWLSSRTGLEAKIEDSGYSVTQVSKTAFYATGGLVLRRYVAGMPSRIEFGYAQQVNTGIVNGIEASRLRGAYFGIDTRLGCTGLACFRMNNQLQIGRVLTQGNPLCDGTLGNGSQIGISACPRGSAIGGGMTVSLVVELSRKKNRSNDLF